MQKYNDKWKLNRVMGHQILSEATSKAYVPYQEVESVAMLVGFLDRPNHFREHMRRFTTSLTTQMTFGFRVVREDDERVEKLFRVCFEVDNL